VVIVIVVIFVMPIAVLGVDDHLFMIMMFLVMMWVIGLSVNPAARRRESEISNRHHQL
jgi:steroid 5-alpha reductase family enzyme